MTLDFGLWTLDSAPRTLDFFNISPRRNPFPPQRRQTLLDIALERRVTPGSGAIIDAHRFVDLQPAGGGMGRREADLAEGDADGGMNFARQVGPAGVRQRLIARRFRDGFGRVHQCQFGFRRSGAVCRRNVEANSLRQHYLEQVQRVRCAPAQPSQPLCPAGRNNRLAPLRWLNPKPGGRTGQGVKAEGEGRRSRSEGRKKAEVRETITKVVKWNFLPLESPCP
jgi:hypothetical protein